MTSVLSSSDPNLSSDISEIEQFRARRRLLCRGQTTAMSPTENEEPIVEDGCMRKFSATWQQKQQLEQCHRQYDHAIWPRSAGIEMCMGYNAFDFSASPEVFYDEPIEPIVTKDYAAQAKQQDIGEVQELHMTKKATSMGFDSASMWNRMLPELCNPKGANQMMQKLGQTSLWKGPLHLTTYNHRRAPYLA